MDRLGKEDVRMLDNMIGHIKKNKKAYKQLVCIVALALFLTQANPIMAYAVDVDEAINKINTITKQLLRLAQVIGSSVNIVMLFKNVINEMFRGNGNISKPVLNYIWIQLVLFFLPTLGDIIASIAE